MMRYNLVAESLLDQRLEVDRGGVGVVVAALDAAASQHGRRSVNGVSDVDVRGTWPPTNTRAELFNLVGASAWWIHRHGGNHAITATINAAFDVPAGGAD